MTDNSIPSVLLRGICVLLLISVQLNCAAQTWSTLNDRGMTLYRGGSYEQAIKTFKEAELIATMQNGGRSKEHLTTLTNMAFAYQSLGDYAEAQSNFRHSKSIADKIYETGNIDRIEALLNLGNSFLPSGEYDSSEYYLEQVDTTIAGAVQSRAQHYLDNIHRFYDASVNAQNSRASLAFRKGQFTRALEILMRLRGDIKLMYPNEYATQETYRSTLNNLATYAMAAGNRRIAGEAIQEQLRMPGRYNERSGDWLAAMNNLGSLHRQTEDYDSAIKTYKEAEAIFKKNPGNTTDIHIAILNNLGELYFAVDSLKSAESYLNQSIAIQEMRAGINPRIYQSTLMNLAETYRWSGELKLAEDVYLKLTDHLLAEIIDNYTYLSDAEKISFFRSNVSIIENFSSFAFEVSGEMRLVKYEKEFKSRLSINRLFDLLLVTKGLILHPSLRVRNDIVKGKDAELKKKYELWEEKKYQYASEARRDNANQQSLARLKEETEVLEKWLRSKSRAFNENFSIERKSWKDVKAALKPDEAAVEFVRLADGLIYGALILTSKDVNGPSVALIKSTGKQHLEKQFTRLYGNMILLQQADTISYDAFWKPVDVALKKLFDGKLPKTIILSPDGVYNQINLHTLLNTKSGKYLIDEVSISTVTNLKDILDKRVKQNSKTAVLLGRPAFYTSVKKNKLIINDLPATEKEVDDIDSILRRNKWKTKVMKYAAADEAAVKSVSSPALLHLATHGFVSQDTSKLDLADMLLNSGIVLAGANNEYQPNPEVDFVTSGQEDNILTAFEMMNLDLAKTDLVVLSACETGLGNFFSGEGIYGLQRSLRSAGAGLVIMSLWKVDDVATQQLMTDFYSRWMKGATVHDAFRGAQLGLRGRFPDPNYWGAFVLSGVN